MTKLIDLSHRKEATDLMVDCALVAVWYGYPGASRLLLNWLKHRTDDAVPVLWINALRHTRFEEFDEAEGILRGILERNPDDPQAVALLSHVLLLSGQPNAAAAMAERLGNAELEPHVLALIDQVRTRHGSARPEPRLSGVAHGAVLG